MIASRSSAFEYQRLFRGGNAPGLLPALDGGRRFADEIGHLADAAEASEDVFGFHAAQVYDSVAHLATSNSHRLRAKISRCRGVDPVTARLKELRNRAAPKLSVRGMATALGIPPSSYAAYEDPAKFKKLALPIDLARRIADVMEPLGIPRADVMELAGITEDMFTGQTRLDAHAVRWVPLVGRAPAGNWREAIETPIGEVAVSAKKAGRNAFAVEVDGDSMNMILPEGGWAVVDPDQVHFYDGRVYLVVNGDHDATMKRYRNNPARLEPVSSNDAHGPFYLTGEPLRIIGRIVAYGNDEGL